jgi:hypothetical protein
MEADNSLRGKALAQARGKQPPRTLTPHEWEQWYAENGVPDSHRQSEPVPQVSWWRRCLSRWSRKGD